MLDTGSGYSLYEAPLKSTYRRVGVEVAAHVLDLELQLLLRSLRSALSRVVSIALNQLRVRIAVP